MSVLSAAASSMDDGGDVPPVPVSAVVASGSACSSWIVLADDHAQSEMTSTDGAAMHDALHEPRKRRGVRLGRRHASAVRTAALRQCSRPCTRERAARGSQLCEHTRHTMKQMQRSPLSARDAVQ